MGHILHIIFFPQKQFSSILISSFSHQSSSMPFLSFYFLSFVGFLLTFNLAFLYVASLSIDGLF